LVPVVAGADEVDVELEIEIEVVGIGSPTKVIQLVWDPQADILVIGELAVFDPPY
jgi:hypothetical protein